MGLSSDEITDESCQGNPSRDCSVNAKVPLKDYANDDVQITASLTSDSVSKADAKTYHGTSGGVEVLLNKTPVQTDLKNDDQGDLTNSKYGDRCLKKSDKDDCLSCPNGGINGNICRNTSPSNTVSAEVSVSKREPVDTSSKDQAGSVSSLELMDTSLHPPNGNSLSGKLGMKNSGGADNDGGNSVALDKVFLKKEAETSTGVGSGNRSSEALNDGEKIEPKVDELRGLPEVQETSVTSQCVDDSDESDFVEQDVKVCDICGDAGREDLLAICSRCTDGAEHTYCMREMLSKVPEGDWLCEECKGEDQINNTKLDKVIVERNYKRQSSGLSNSSDSLPSLKLDKKDSDGDRKISNKDYSSLKASSKRRADSVEVSVAKRQALESTIGSPKASSSSRVPALSRDSSFRSLDKGKVKPGHQLSSGSVSSNNTSQDAFHLSNQRLRKPQGSLSKSSSFNATLAKPKVELDDIDPKKKSAGESSSLGSKEVGVRSIGKSMSFKSGNPSRFNAPESKVKMLSPKYPHGQDLKLSKSSKERNLLERRSSFRSNRPVMGLATGSSTLSVMKNDKKVASFGENGALPSASNNREFKGSQFDSKPSKPVGYVPRKSLDLPAPLGENKRQLCPPVGVGTSLTNGISSSSAQTHASLKNDPPSSTGAVEKQSNKVNESIRDALPRPWGAALGERNREGSSNRSRPTLITGERSGPCQKCNELGHSAEFCSVASSTSLLDAAKSPKEVTNKGNDLKAAIEAAMLKKPGIYRKSKISGQSDDSTLSNINLNGEIRSQDQSLTPLNSRNMLHEIHEGQAGLRNSATDSFKQTKAGGLSALVPTDEKPSRSDFPGHALAAVSCLKISSIPDHEHVWQGSFEVNKREIRELHVGIQAHLSTTSSPKVLEEVKKFPSKINFIEVPRLSTWPKQFKETGAKEDNIALYFFAKDLESYERSYKVLVETMMRSDLALRGTFGGVELLIFPSSHLPDKSQRWNMLYFLWGVFRGKKMNCLQNVSGFPRERLIGRDVPSAASLSDKTPLPEPKDLAHSKACNIVAASQCPPFSNSPRLTPQSASAVCNAKAGLHDPKDQHLNKNMVELDCRPDVNSLPTTERINVVTLQEISSSSTNSMDENVDPLSKPGIEPQPYVQASRTIDASQKTVSTAAVHPDKSPDKPFDCSHGIVDSVKTLKEQEGSLETKSSLQRENFPGHQSLDDLNCLPTTFPETTLLENLSEPASQASGVSRTSRNETSSVSPYGECASKDRGTVFTPMYDVGASSPMKAHRSQEGCNERGIQTNNDPPEMLFFKVDPHPVKGFKTEDDNRLIDVVPNLELALGAEMKPSRPGILPFLEGKVELRESWNQPLENTAKEEEDDASASLSLSLSFPSSEVEQTSKSVPKAQPLMPADRSHVNTSLLFFNNSSEG